jgi:hypothetical protein
MKKTLIAIIAVILVAAVLIGALTLHLNNQMKWEIHEPMDAAMQEDFSYRALLPETAGIWERYGERGLRDAEYMLESHMFGSADEMYNALPSDYKEGIEESIKSGTAEKNTDIKGNTVESIQIQYLPLATKDELPKKYEYYTYGVFTEYYILDYGNGCYRIAVKIATT